MIVTFRVPQEAPGDDAAAHVDVQAWWPDEWDLPAAGQVVSIEEGWNRSIRRVVLEPGSPTQWTPGYQLGSGGELLEVGRRGRVRCELEDRRFR